MTYAPDDRRIVIWHGPQDISTLTRAVFEEAMTELFDLNKVLVWLQAGRPIPVNKDLLREIITRHIVSMRLADRGEFGSAAEFFSFDFPPIADVTKEPNEKVLVDMIAMLLELAAKGPQEPPKLSEQQRGEMRMRVQMGEPREVVAAYYKVGADTIREVMAAA